LLHCVLRVRIQPRQVMLMEEERSVPAVEKRGLKLVRLWSVGDVGGGGGGVVSGGGGGGLRRVLPSW
jgi:hypothetical protein